MKAGASSTIAPRYGGHATTESQLEAEIFDLRIVEREREEGMEEEAA